MNQPRASGRIDRPHLYVRHVPHLNKWRVFVRYPDGGTKISSRCKSLHTALITGYRYIRKRKP